MHFAYSMLLLLFFQSVASVAASDAKSRVIEQVENLTPLIDKMSDTLWDYSELGLMEHRSAQYMTETLEKSGFHVRRGVAQLPTAFVARAARCGCSSTPTWPCPASPSRCGFRSLPATPMPVSP